MFGILILSYGETTVPRKKEQYNNNNITINNI